MIRLYHGSNVGIKHIDLSRSKRGKDFGQGFYLNANLNQAMAMAIRTARFMDEGQPTLSCFEFDDTKAYEIGLKNRRNESGEYKKYKYASTNERENEEHSRKPTDEEIEKVRRELEDMRRNR